MYTSSTILNIFVYLFICLILCFYFTVVAIESALATLTTDKDVCKWAEEKDASGNYIEKKIITAWGFKNVVVKEESNRWATWTDLDQKSLIPITGEKQITTTNISEQPLMDATCDKIKEVFPDGLPKTKSGNWLAITIGAKDGSPYAMCRLYKPSGTIEFTSDGEPKNTYSLLEEIDGYEE